MFLTVLACSLPLGLGCERSPEGPPSIPAKDRAGVGGNPGEWFIDITDRSGVRFTHAVGTNYFMPDQIGSGIALFDYDNDGRLDLYAVQDGGPGSTARNQLFHQERDGTFRDVSAGSGLDVAGRGMGAIAGDVNNDGLPDVVVTEYGAVRLFLNLGGGRFREVTRAAGLDNPRWAVPASFIDVDRDGWLDLVVGNYVDYDPTHLCRDAKGEQDFCAPRSFDTTATRLWRNTTGTAGAEPRFTDITESSGLTRAPGVALGLVCADFDGDGWPDIFCSDDERPNRLFMNRRDGTFVEEAVARGLAFNAMGGTSANMGTAFGDVDGDGLPDLFVTHLSEEFHSLWRQGPRGVFRDEVASAGLQRRAWRGTGFGAVLADFDGDGAPDLALANGLVRRSAAPQTPVAEGLTPWWARYAQRAQIFVNEGSGRFRDVSEGNRQFCGRALVGRSLAVGDLDNDGAPDLVMGSLGGPLRLYRNTAPRRGHWLRVRVVDPRLGGRDAIGAEVTVEAGGRRWFAVLQPAMSYLASHDPILSFGLGAASAAGRITVLWPDGLEEKFPGGPVDTLRVLRRGEGK